MEIPHSILPLDLNQKETEHLILLYDTLEKKLEKFGALQSEWMKNLNESMKTILESQPQFSKISNAARNSHQILHLTHPDPNILNLPWRLAVQDLSLLSLTKGKPVKGGDFPLLKTYDPPLKILVMISSPEDLGFDSRLSYEEEEELIINSFEPLFNIGQVQIDFTDDGSLESLMEKIAANNYHIIHFSGHGAYKDGLGYLVLEDNLAMRKQLVSATDFASVFDQNTKNMPALFVLTSCQSAMGKLELGMQSVADELLLRGLPAVIAMSVSITDYFATFFSGVLYKNLAEKKALNFSFQEAVEKTRQHEIEKIPQLLPSQWMIPQLFLSKKVEQIVDWEKTESRLDYSFPNLINEKQDSTLQTQKNYRFVGRRQDRKLIYPALLNHTSVLLKGQGGVGKTAMANYLSHRLLVKDPNTKVFVFNETNTNLERILKHLKSFLLDQNLQKIVIEGDKLHGDNQFIQFKWLLKKIQVKWNPVLVFDNLETLQSAPGKALKDKLLKDVLEFLYENKLLLVLTSRYPLYEFPDIPSFDLNQVSQIDYLKKSLQLSLENFPKKIRQIKLSYIIEERLTFREVIKWLYETLGGNYRALEMFDELYKRKIEEFDQTLKNLAEFKKAFANETYETRQYMGKALLFKELLTLLSSDEKITLRLLTCFRIPVLIDALKMQRNDLDFRRLLAKLLDLTLLEKHMDLREPEFVYYYVTPLIKELTKREFDNQIEFGADQAGEYHWLAGKDLKKYWNIEDLTEAFLFFLEAKNKELADKAGYYLGNIYYQVSQFQKALDYGLQVFELNESEASYEVLEIIASSYDILGYPKKALKFNKLHREKAKSEDNTYKHIISLDGIGSSYRRLGELEDALIYLNLALQLCLKIENKYLEASLLNNISKVYVQSGNYDEALKKLDQVLKISREKSEISTEVDALCSIGFILKIRGEVKKALNNYKQALELAKQTRNKRGESAILDNIAGIYKALGDNERALEYMGKALLVNKEIGYKLGEVTSLNNIGQLYQIIGDYDNALRFLELTLQSNREINDKQGESIALVSIGQIYYHRKDYDNSLICLQQALAIQRQIKDIKEECITLNNLGEVFKAKGDLESALNFLTQSLNISKAIGDLASECNTLNNISTIYRKKGNDQTATVYLNQSLKIAIEIKNKKLESQALHGLAFSAKKNRDFEKYLFYEKKCYQIAVDTGNAYNMYRYGTDLGVFLCENGAIEEGLPILQKSLAISQRNNLPDTNYIASAIKHFQNLKNG